MGDTFTITQSATSLTTTFNDPTEDGFIYHDTGTAYDRYDNDDYIYARVDGAGGKYRAYVEWDISNIPSSSSSVTNVKLLYHCQSRTGSCDCNVKEMLDIQPSVFSDTSARNQDIYEAVDSGTSYYTTAGFPAIGENKSITLGVTGSQVCADVLSQATVGWFAIGIQLQTEPVQNRSAWFNSEEFWATNPAFSLYVEYDPTLVVTINKPSNLTRSYTRRIKRHTFRDGTYELQDVGKRIKTITMNGIEPSGESDISNIDNMLDLGLPITISGMDDDNLNTDWYITDFTWEKNEQISVNDYAWSMTLEEA